jgi:hypothetical protein
MTQLQYDTYDGASRYIDYRQVPIFLPIAGFLLGLVVCLYRKKKSGD